MKGAKGKSIFVMISFFTLSILVAQPSQLTIENKNIFKDKQRSEVTFPHAKHMLGEFSCKRCHHNYVNKKNVIDDSQLVQGNTKIKCASCHRSQKSGNRESLMNAYHLQCMGCHKNMDNKGKKSGPRICAQCHPKKKDKIFNWR